MATGTGLNEVRLLGNLGGKPELKYLPNGTAVVNVSLYTDESYIDRNTNQEVERGEWHRLAIFGRKAEVFAEYLDKGDQVFISHGRNQTREWEAEDGSKRYTTEVVVEEFKFLRGKKRSDQPTQPAPAQQPGVTDQQAAHGQTTYGQQPQQPQAVPSGFYYDNGQAMSPQDVAKYKPYYPNGWPQGSTVPVLPQR